MKSCPFCAEEIQDAAIVCKHCGRDLLPNTSSRIIQNVTTATGPTNFIALPINQSEMHFNFWWFLFCLFIPYISIFVGWSTLNDPLKRARSKTVMIVSGVILGLMVVGYASGA